MILFVQLKRTSCFLFNQDKMRATSQVRHPERSEGSPIDYI